MAVKWINTNFPGVRYYVHPTRKTKNGKPDKYFTIRFSHKGCRKEEGLGWSSEGWNAEKCFALLAEIKEALRTGRGAQSVAEMRELSARAQSEAAAAQKIENLKNLSFGAFLETYYLPHVQREKRTWDDDKSRMRAILPALGHLPLSSIKAAHIQKFLDALNERGLAPATVRQYFALIRHAFNVAQKIVIDDMPLFSGPNPTSELTPPAVVNSRERYLLPEEAALLLEKARQQPSPDLHDAISLALCTGLRLGELVRLTWADVDFHANILTVRSETRRKPGGKVPLNADARELLMQRKKGAQEGDLIFGATARDAGGSLSQKFNRIVQSAGLNDGITDPRKKIVFHSLRHTFASWLALAGTDIYRIKILMRHQTIAMTMRYAHLIPDATRDAVNKISLKPAGGK